MNFIITIFASSSVKGKLLEKSLSQTGAGGLHCYVESLLQEKYDQQIEVGINFIYSDAPEYEFHRAVLYSDVVIFDGSLEEDGIALGENYACITHAPYLMDNVIVVSRTVLPINFIPNAYQTNVVPIGEETEEERERNPQKLYTNEEIIKWLKGCLAAMIEEGRLPRKPEFKIAKELLTDSKTISNYFNKIYPLTEGNKKNRYEHTAFISYRSYYGEHKSNGYSIKELEKVILDYHKKNNPTEKWRVMFYASGSLALAQDCPTEFHRWRLLTYIANRMKQVDEVWVFNTHDLSYGPSYWDSWFTQGEIISLMDLKQYLPNSCPDVYMFDTSKKDFERLKELPSLNKKIHNSLAITMANTDPEYGDVFAYQNVSLLKENWQLLPTWIRWGLSLYVRLFFGSSLKKQLASHSYDRSFWTNRIITCPNCCKTGQNLDSFSGESFVEEFINLSSLPIGNNYGVFTLSEKDFQCALNQGFVTCPNCGKHLKVLESNQYYYIWERNMSQTKDHKYIEKVRAYNIEEIE